MSVTDDIRDSVALIEALRRGDAEGVRTILRFADGPRTALVCAGWLVGILARVSAEDQACIIGGWRQDALEIEMRP